MPGDVATVTGTPTMARTSSMSKSQMILSGGGLPVFVRKAINMPLSPLAETSNDPRYSNTRRPTLERANTVAVVGRCRTRVRRHGLRCPSLWVSDSINACV
jgi:hypothetical protein